MTQLILMSSLEAPDDRILGYRDPFLNLKLFFVYHRTEGASTNGRSTLCSLGRSEAMLEVVVVVGIELVEAADLLYWLGDEFGSTRG